MSYVADIFAFQDWAEYESSITPNDIVLWFALMRIFNKLGNPEELEIPISTLIPKCKLSRRQIYRSRNRLKQLGLIDFKERKGNSCSIYKAVKFKRPSVAGNELASRFRETNEASDGGKNDASKDAQDNAVGRFWHTNCHTPCHTDVTQTVTQMSHECHTTSLKPRTTSGFEGSLKNKTKTKNKNKIPPKSTNVDIPPTRTDDEHGGDGQAQIPVENKSELKTKPKPKVKTKVQSSEIDTLFAEFWSAYPRKVAKQAAQRAFAKLKPDRKKLDEILDGIARYKKSEQWEDKQFIPHPATFLNGARWEDEVEPREGFKTSYDLEAYKKMSRDMLMRGIEADRQPESEEVPWFKNTDPSFWYGKEWDGAKIHENGL